MRDPDQTEEIDENFESDEAISKHIAKQSAQWNHTRYGYQPGDDDVFDGGSKTHTEWKPHYILSTWENDDGIRCISVLVALTGGTVDRSTAGIAIDLDEDGTILCISEVWAAHTQDMNVFYSHFPKQSGESEDDFTRRRFQMDACLRRMRDKYGNDDGEMYSEFRMQLPFRVEPTEKKVTFIGDSKGGRYAHIDLIEKKLHEVHGVLLIDDAAPVNKGLVTPATKKTKYSKY